MLNEYSQLYQKEYRQRPENKARMKTYQATYYQLHKERIKVQHKEHYQSYYPSYKERKVRYEREYRQLYPEKVREQAHKYHQSHPKELRNYRQLHKKESAERARRWKKAHPERVAQHTRRHLGKGFVPLAPNIFDCPVAWHHLAPNQPYVVPIPRAIHVKFGGSRHYVIVDSFIPFLFGCASEKKQ